jgi:hypothetical protein
VLGRKAARRFERLLPQLQSVVNPVLAPALFDMWALLNPFGTLESSVNEPAELFK